jgi:integrase
MGIPALKLIEPTTENLTVIVRRPPNAELRSREYLTPAEVDRLVEAAKSNRWPLRDATMVLVGYRHGLRAKEVVELEWDQVDFAHSTLSVRRAKGGKPSAHPLQGDTMRALRKLRKDNPYGKFVFVSEREDPFTEAGFAKMIERLGRKAAFAFKVHPHMLRHACGYKLANDGKDTRSLADYLGHRNMQNTMRYTELNATRFKDFWR